MALCDLVEGHPIVVGSVATWQMGPGPSVKLVKHPSLVARAAFHRQSKTL